MSRRERDAEKARYFQRMIQEAEWDLAETEQQCTALVEPPSNLSAPIPTAAFSAWLLHPPPPAVAGGTEHGKLG